MTTEKERFFGLAQELDVDLLSIIASSLSDIIAIHRPDGMCGYVSPSVERVLGYSQEEFLEHSPFEYYHPDDIHQMKERFERAKAGLPTSSRIEYQIRKKDGSYIWLQTEASRIYDAEGKFQVVLAISRDITERKQEEKARQDSEERYRQLFMNSPAVKLVVDPENGAIIAANWAATEFYGYTAAEFSRMSILDISPDSEKVTEWRESCIIQGRRRLRRHLMKDGTYREVEVYAGPVDIDGKAAVHSIIVDVTEKKKIEQELKQSRDRLTLVIDAAQAGIWDWDIINGRMFLDNKLKAIFGLDKCEDYYDGWQSKIYPDDVAMVERAVQDYLLGITSNLEIVCRIRHRDKSYRWVRVSGLSIADETGKPVRITGSAIDITAPKLAVELQRESDERLSDFLRAIPDAGFIIDEDGRYLEILTNNDEKLFIPREDTVGKTISEVLSAENAKLSMGDLRKALDTGMPQARTGSLEYRNKKHYYNIRTAPMRYLANGKRTVAVVVSDTTEQVENENKVRFSYELRRRSDILNDSINGGTVVTRQLVDSALAMNIDLFAPMFCCLLSLCRSSDDECDSSDIHSVKDDIMFLLGSESEQLVWDRHGDIGILCRAEQDDGPEKSVELATRLREKLRSCAPNLQVIIGVSHIHSGVSGIRECFQQALDAVVAARCQWAGAEGIYHFRDLGLWQLFAGFGDKDQATDFVERNIGKLIRYDRDKGADLTRTLEVLLEKDNLKEAADTLYVHHKTMIFRKKRIEQILGILVDEFEVRIALSVAIKLRKLISLASG